MFCFDWVNNISVTDSSETWGQFLYKPNRINFIRIHQASAVEMHHFFSIAFSLLSIFGLHVSVQSTERRSERSIKRNYNSLLTVPNGMEWGSWGFKDMCSSGMYAAGFSLKVSCSNMGVS